MKKLALVGILAFFALISVSGTSFAQKAKVTKVAPAAAYKPPYSGADLAKLTSHPKQLLVIKTKLGTIKVQLFDKIAPHHVSQIVKLAKEHFYDGTTFHRVIPGFMIQGGDPNSKDNDLSNDGQGGYKDALMAEFSQWHHARGVASMARTQDPNSATSQFFLCVDNAPQLDNQYTVWGQIVSGMDVADKIVALKRDANDNPGKASVMTKVTIEGK